MKVVWICHFSNKEIRCHIRCKTNPITVGYQKLKYGKQGPAQDWAIWNTNAINEIKKFDDIELHVINVYPNLSTQLQEFCLDGIHYHIINDEGSNLINSIIYKLKNVRPTRKNRAEIFKVINLVHPDIIHIIGAENPQYSLSLLDIPKDIPNILQLQTLLSLIRSQVSGVKEKNYSSRAKYEEKLIKNAMFIGTCVPVYIDYIKNNIKPDVKILNTTLAMGQNINLKEEKKEFTFVHFALTPGKSKATDIAMKAFGIAHQSHPEITLDLIGSPTEETKNELDKIINQYNIRDAVKFEGTLPTHEDVIAQIRKSRFALLPIKVDIVPNTLHEAMANGLPLLTTVTSGTPALNEKRKSVLISPEGDYVDLANNMITLIENEELSNELRSNAAITESEHLSNYDIIKHWVDTYNVILENKITGKMIPPEFFSYKNEENRRD